MRGLVGTLDGSTLLKASIEGPSAQAHALGVALAEDLLGQGAKAILDAVYAQQS